MLATIGQNIAENERFGEVTQPSGKEQPASLTLPFPGSPPSPVVSSELPLLPTETSSHTVLQS